MSLKSVLVFEELSFYLYVWNLLRFMYVLLCALEMDAAIKKLTFPLDQSALCTSSWYMHSFAIAKFIWRTLHFFLFLSASNSLARLLFVLTSTKTSGKDASKSLTTFPIYKPACSDTVALSHTYSY